MFFRPELPAIFDSLKVSQTEGLNIVITCITTHSVGAALSYWASFFIASFFISTIPPHTHTHTHTIGPSISNYTDVFLCLQLQTSQNNFFSLSSYIHVTHPHIPCTLLCSMFYHFPITQSTFYQNPFALTN